MEFGALEMMHCDPFMVYLSCRDSLLSIIIFLSLVPAFQTRSLSRYPQHCTILPHFCLISYYMYIFTVH